jgi:hypothetical protein
LTHGVKESSLPYSRTGVKTDAEKATKRIPVTPEVWAILHDQRQPGESYDIMLKRIVHEAGTYRLIRDTDETERENDFIPLEDLDKEN